VDLLKLHNQAKVDFKKGFELEDTLTTVEGNRYTDSLIKGVEGDIITTAEGNPKPFILRLKELSQPDLFHALKPWQEQRFKSVVDLKNTAMDIVLKGFRGFIEKRGMEGYMKLRRDPAAAKEVLQNLDPELVSTLDNVQKISRKVAVRSKKAGAKISQAEIAEVMDTSMEIIDAMLGVASAQYYSPVARFGGRFISRFRSNSVQKAVKLFESSAFQKLMIDRASGKSTTAATDALVKTPIYKKWVEDLPAKAQGIIATDGIESVVFPTQVGVTGALAAE